MKLKSVLEDVLPNLIGVAMASAAANPRVPLDRYQAPRVAQEVAQSVVDQIQDNPEIKDLTARVEHLTSSESWYQSRANWSAIVSGLTPLLAIAGYNLSPEDQALVAAALGIAGGWLASYLARRARTATKPLGA